MKFLAAIALACAITLGASGDQRCESCPRTASGRIKRSAAARREFKRLHLCPSTGKPTGACPGYVIDHIDPLQCGGPDVPRNMQWQTREEAKEKDRDERSCRG
jgi:hypothetical protein